MRRIDHTLAQGSDSMGPANRLADYLPYFIEHRSHGVTEPLPWIRILKRSPI